METPTQFPAMLKAERIVRVPGTVVFLTKPTDRVPTFFSDYARDLGALHRIVVALNVRFESRPRVPLVERFTVEEIQLLAGDCARLLYQNPRPHVRPAQSAGIAGRFRPRRVVFVGLQDSSMSRATRHQLNLG